MSCNHELGTNGRAVAAGATSFPGSLILPQAVRWKTLGTRLQPEENASYITMITEDFLTTHWHLHFHFQTTSSKCAVFFHDVKHLPRRLCDRSCYFCYKHIGIGDVCKEERLHSGGEPRYVCIIRNNRRPMCPWKGTRYCQLSLKGTHSGKSRVSAMAWACNNGVKCCKR